ncbi:alpha/beta hydrolase [Longispora sp. NPDC051575]|uniref:alpha/beta fold hydrolase n=1 Tax=Longispora sp. NPDC051575 TaxID=3154943 RepID=UPI003439C7FF
MTDTNVVNLSRRRVLVGSGLAATALTLGATMNPTEASADTAATEGHRPKPTVVLVHGAFADASGWKGVIGELTRAGHDVLAPANPLRSLAGDAAYIASVVNAVPGPVILVGHSYGGAVITNAARSTPNVKALVYVAAFGLAKDESLAGISASYPETPLAKAVRPQPYPLADGTAGTDLYIDRASFKSVFAQDVPSKDNAIYAATQRPLSAAAFTEASGEPAWKTLPSFYQVSRNDRCIHPDAQRFFAKRMGAKKTIELDSSHASLVSHPDEIADLIRLAARTTA